MADWEKIERLACPPNMDVFFCRPFSSSNCVWMCDPGISNTKASNTDLVSCLIACIAADPFSVQRAPSGCSHACAAAAQYWRYICNVSAKPRFFRLPRESDKFHERLRYRNVSNPWMPAKTKFEIPAFDGCRVRVPAATCRGPCMANRPILQLRIRKNNDASSNFAGPRLTASHR